MTGICRQLRQLKRSAAPCTATELPLRFKVATVAWPQLVHILAWLALPDSAPPGYATHMASFPLRTATITEAVVMALRDDLLTCRLLPGHRLSIKDLAAAYEASTGAVREALSRLSGEGLVVAEAQRGFRVAGISSRDLEQVTEARIYIETICVRQSLEHADLEWEGKLIATLHRLSKVSQGRDGTPPYGPEWTSAHGEFHECLSANCPNVYLRQSRTQLAALAQRYHLLSARIAPTSRDALAEHEAITDAAVSRDADLTVALLASHMRRTMEILLEAPELRQGADPDRYSARETASARG